MESIADTTEDCIKSLSIKLDECREKLENKCLTLQEEITDNVNRLNSTIDELDKKVSEMIKAFEVKTNDFDLKQLEEVLQD